MVPREGYYFATGKTPERIGNGHYQIVPYNSFDTADGRQIFVMAHTDKFWQALVDALEVPALAEPRFATNTARRDARAEVNGLIAAAFARRTADEWNRLLSATGALFSTVRTLDEVFSHPEVQRTMVRTVEHPSAGPIRLLANPVRLSDTPLGIRHPPPLLGQHTEELKAEFGL
jgi:crotonobetainyl-CoA:carnitine CoA-transferase CaiB-like acyl-CoA transferase